ncbi:isoleucyl-tRNA synthetase [Cystobasidium minutum MCA 4210]|uniref:isoleucyl-tRNA synthetase n=1 Tax=Cystobasidium minutum MCA 4210 TaxID=1397322 RepID=UPI0034CF52F4|eukprot:jgi/Rhomi1/105498/CE105497_1167
MWLRCSALTKQALGSQAINESCSICTRTLSRRHLHISRRLAAQTTANKSSNDKAFAKTLLLPKTDFPLRADAANREKLFRKKTTETLYKWQWSEKLRPLFVLHDGPPYANGNVHIGHALNKILKDVINRYKLLRGYRIHYMPGFDCHGLPIEHKALKQLEADHRQMDPLEVRKVARKTAEKAIKVQMKEFKDFGIMTDWDNVYRTYDRSYEIRQLRVFQTMLKKGLIYRQEKPVLWSPSSRTALAEAEIEYKEDHVSETVYVHFPLMTRGKKLEEVIAQHPELADKTVSLVIWTTTPWTLPANMFVAYGKNIEYCLVQSSSGYLIVARDRVEALSQLTGGHLQILSTFRGDDLQGSRYTPPYLTAAARETGLPVVSADYVTADSGTGLVHSAPAHGMDDYAAWKAQEAESESANTTMASYVDADGQYGGNLSSEIVSPDVTGLVGASVLSDAPAKVIEDLKARGLLLASAKIRHKYPHDWRTKQPVIVRSTPQWFANVENIKTQAVNALQSVNFVPDQGRNRLEAFTRSRSEWCISRQRSWGVPIPMLFDVKTGTPNMDDSVLSHIVAVLAEKGIDHWWRGAVEDFLPPSMQNTSSSYYKGTDTMDVWFDSGVSWTGIEELLQAEGLGTRTPLTEAYLEGSDQHRGWFQSSLLTSIAVKGVAPFANVITHGFVLDKDGVKMSKSIGNVISPLTVINGGDDKAKLPAYGTDVLRFWAASSGYTRDVTCSMDTISGSAETLRKIRNTLRFILGNLSNATPEERSLPSSLSFVDRYVLHELSQLSKNVREAYDEYQFNKGLAGVTQYCTSVLSSFYFGIIKDSLYADSATSSRRTAIVYTLQQVLSRLTYAIAPVTPHLAEDVWQHWPSSGRSGTESFFQKTWQDQDLPREDDQFISIMNTMLQLRREAMAAIEAARRGER